MEIKCFFQISESNCNFEKKDPILKTPQKKKNISTKILHADIIVPN